MLMPHPTFTIGSLCEMNTLGIRVRQKALLAHLAAKTTVLEAREVGAHVWSLGLVDPDTPGIQTTSDSFGLG